MTSALIGDTQRVDRDESGNMTMVAEIGVMWLSVRNVWSHQKLDERKNGSSPRPSGGSTSLLIP